MACSEKATGFFVTNFMTLGEIQSKIYSLTGTDSTTYSDADMLIDINIWLNNVVGAILDAEDESAYDDPRYTDFPIVTTPLTTNRDYKINQTLTNTDAISYSVLKNKSLSVSYDGVNFYRAKPMDLTDFDIGNATDSDSTQNSTIDAQFSKTSPRYDVKFNSIFLYPRASASDVAAGGKIISEWFRSARQFTSAELSAGTVIPGFDVNFHLMLAYGPSFEFCMPKGLPQTNFIQEKLQEYEQKLGKQYSSKQLDRKYFMQADYQSYK